VRAAVQCSASTVTVVSKTTVQPNPYPFVSLAKTPVAYLLSCPLAER
jgi:hypothetical protein